MTRIAIVEDNRVIRESFIEFLHSDPEFTCVCACATAEEALKLIPKCHPAIVLMDIQLPNLSGIECTAQLKQLLPEVQIIMVTVYEDTDQIFKALAAGATGYLLKRSSPTKLLQAIREIYAGGSPMTSSIARKVVASFQKSKQIGEKPTHLSPREEMVLNCLAKGLTYKQIADQLEISIDTIRTYLRRVYEKLHVQSRTEAVAKYLSH